MEGVNEKIQLTFFLLVHVSQRKPPEIENETLIQEMRCLFTMLRIKSFNIFSCHLVFRPNLCPKGQDTNMITKKF